MAPRVRFLQKVQKQLPVNEEADEADHLKEMEQNTDSLSSVNEGGVEKQGANLSGNVSVNKKQSERRKETEERSASSEAEESGESEDESKEISEEEDEEVTVPSGVPNPDTVQFFEDDDDDDDDAKDTDLLTVKRRNIFGVEESPALVSVLFTVRLMNLNDFILDILQVRRRKQKILLLEEYLLEVRCVFRMQQRSELRPKEKWCGFTLLSL